MSPAFKPKLSEAQSYRDGTITVSPKGVISASCYGFNKSHHKSDHAAKLWITKVMAKYSQTLGIEETTHDD